MIQPITSISYRQQQYKPSFKGFYDPACVTITSEMRANAVSAREYYFKKMFDGLRDLFVKKPEKFSYPLAEEYHILPDGTFGITKITEKIGEKASVVTKRYEFIDGANYVDMETGDLVHFLYDGSTVTIPGPINHQIIKETQNFDFAWPSDKFHTMESFANGLKPEIQDVAADVKQSTVENIVNNPEEVATSVVDKYKSSIENIKNSYKEKFALLNDDSQMVETLGEGIGGGVEGTLINNADGITFTENIDTEDFVGDLDIDTASDIGESIADNGEAIEEVIDIITDIF